MNLTDSFVMGVGWSYCRTSWKTDRNIMGNAHTSRIHLVDTVVVALFQLQKHCYYHYIIIYITTRRWPWCARLLVAIVNSLRGTYNVFHHRLSTSKTSDSFKMIYNDRKCQHSEAARGHNDDAWRCGEPVCRRLSARYKYFI